MKLFGITGWSNSGKTFLMVELVRVLVARGFTVSTVKHASRSLEFDQTGKDSYRHRHAGADQVIVSSPLRWAVLTENRTREEPSLQDLVGQLRPVDLVLVEGYKRSPHRKLEVYRPSIGKPPLWPEVDSVIGVCSDEPVVAGELPVLALDDFEGIADFILRDVGLSAPGATVQSLF
ncbi:MAG: molybdopterin-guanine dinucleotide biosynthesis protein B [Magnetospiraceae bacterium]